MLLDLKELLRIMLIFLLLEFAWSNQICAVSVKNYWGLLLLIWPWTEYNATHFCFCSKTIRKSLLYWLHHYHHHGDHQTSQVPDRSGLIAVTSFDLTVATASGCLLPPRPCLSFSTICQLIFSFVFVFVYIVFRYLSVFNQICVLELMLTYTPSHYYIFLTTSPKAQQTRG